MRDMIAKLLDSVFPRCCPACDVRLAAPQASFCELCAVGCLGPEPGCDVCGLPMAADPASQRCGGCLVKRPMLRRTRWAAEYGGAVQTAIQRFKYRRRTDVLDGLLSLGLPDTALVDVVMPVPLHWRRRLVRGFNQAALIARRVGSRQRVPVDCSALSRFRATLPQARLSEAGRAENVRGAFRVDAPGRVRGRRVLLVDDVVTTGATANECARVLKQAGATSVDLWSIARAL